MSEYQNLLAQKAALEAQIATAQAEAKAKAVTEARALIQEHGLTAADVFPAAKAKGSVGVPKYRDPATGAPGPAGASRRTGSTARTARRS
ncbi:histone [Delftia tsuruhatensis]|nr:histone [Delftia tsuruhatensis]